VKLKAVSIPKGKKGQGRARLLKKVTGGTYKKIIVYKKILT
jgi:hypothetical protein